MSWSQPQDDPTTRWSSSWNTSLKKSLVYPEHLQKSEKILWKLRTNAFFRAAYGTEKSWKKTVPGIANSSNPSIGQWQFWHKESLWKFIIILSVKTHPSYLSSSQHQLGLGDGRLHWRLLGRLARLLWVPRLFVRFRLRWAGDGGKEEEISNSWLKTLYFKNFLQHGFIYSGFILFLSYQSLYFPNFNIISF